MASKWLEKKKEMFEKFKEDKKHEAEQTSAGPRRSEIVWKTPEKGTVEKPKNYLLRLIPDNNSNFYKTFLYHMFQDKNGKWNFVFCPKTWNFENYCPLCAATMKLYKGDKQDKKTAYNYKRKRKHCGNVYVVKDPRDTEAEDANDKNSGKVLIYEFPDAVESKIKSEMMDDEFGQGMNIFDPGEDGVDFILKVGATKPIQDQSSPLYGKSFPEYSDSKFSNKNYALGKDEQIQQIMDSTHDLDEYLKSMERKESELIEIVKDEMLWDIISSDYPKNNEKKSNPGPQKAESVEEMDDAPFDNEDDQSQDNQSQDNDDISDDDLLKELDNM